MILNLGRLRRFALIALLIFSAILAGQIAHEVVHAAERTPCEFCRALESPALMPDVPQVICAPAIEAGCPTRFQSIFCADAPRTIWTRGPPASLPPL
jgi:hypothetical protein